MPTYPPIVSTSYTDLTMPSERSISQLSAQMTDFLHKLETEVSPLPPLVLPPLVLPPQGEMQKQVLSPLGELLDGDVSDILMLLESSPTK